MVKSYSFYFTAYRLFSSVLGGHILVCCDLHAGVLFYSHVCNYCFSTAIFRIKLFRHHVLFNSFCTDRNHECAARTFMVGSTSPLSPSLYRHRSGPAFSESRLLVFACRLVLNEQNFATRKKSLKTG